MIRVIHAIFNSVKGICKSMLELQQLASFGSKLFLVLGTFSKKYITEKALE